jgi:hypothetical protein
MLAIQVHRHRSSPTIGIYGGLGLAAADRPRQKNARIGDRFWATGKRCMPIVYPKVDDLRNHTLSPSWWRADLPLLFVDDAIA